MKKQIERACKLLKVIEEHGIINMYDAVEYAGLSMNEYYQMSGWFIHKYQDRLKQIEYNRSTKEFRWCILNQSSEAA